MAVAFPQPFPHDHDLNYPDLLLLMDLNLILQAAVNCPMIMMLMVQAITPNLIQDLRRTRVETSYSLGIGNHPIMTQQAEVFHLISFYIFLLFEGRICDFKWIGWIGNIFFRDVVFLWLILPIRKTQNKIKIILCERKQTNVFLIIFLYGNRTNEILWKNGM